MTVSDQTHEHFFRHGAHRSVKTAVMASVVLSVTGATLLVDLKS